MNVSKYTFLELTFSSYVVCQKGLSIGVLITRLVSLNRVQPHCELRLILVPVGVVWDFYVSNGLFVNLVSV